MVEKPCLIVFSQDKMGGVQNYYYNLLSHLPLDDFQTKWIFLKDDTDNDPKLPQRFNLTKEITLDVQDEPSAFLTLAKKIKTLIPPGPGVILTNFGTELRALHLFRQRQKTIYFICHDELYLPAAKHFEFLVDVFIAHNYAFFEELRTMLPQRVNDIFYLPYGVAKTTLVRAVNLNQPLKIVIAARLQVLKGVYDLPQIDELLRMQSIIPRWTIIGDGPEKENLITITKSRGNFCFKTLANSDDVRAELSANDVFILPSRLDGLPVSLLEAMSVGCVPVISAFNNGIQRVVTNDLGFVLPVGDNRAFAEKIAFLHHNRKALEEKSAKARMKIADEFDIDHRANDYLQLFRQRLGYKKRVAFKVYNYKGLLNHPFIPDSIRKFIRRLKKPLNR